MGPIFKCFHYRAGYFFRLSHLAIHCFLHREVTVIFKAPVEQEMRFPAVTVCNLNAYNKDDLEAINFCIPVDMYEEVPFLLQNVGSLFCPSLISPLCRLW